MSQRAARNPPARANRRVRQARPQGGATGNFAQATPATPLHPLHAGVNAHKDRAEEQYLASFVDPQHAARGPGSGNYPTITGQFKSSSGIKFDSTVAGEPDATTNGGPYPLNANGEAIVVVAPHMPFLENSGETGFDITGPPTANLCSGFVCKPEALMEHNVYGAVGASRPLQPFQSLLPDMTVGKFASIAVPDDAQDGTSGLLKCAGMSDTNPGSEIQFLREESLGRCISYRTVGLRATLTVTDPLTESTGIVYAGDTCDYYQDIGGSYINRNDVTKNYEQISGFSGGNPATAEFTTLGNQSVRPRVTQAGAFSKGNIFEASLLPTSDRVLNYSDRVLVTPCDTVKRILEDVGTVAATQPAYTAALDYYDCGLGEFLSNQPSIMFDLRGLRDGAVCNVSVTWSIEMQVEPTSSIGFLLAEARFAPRFVPDWMEFACCAPGGVLGEVMSHYLNCERKTVGFIANAVGLSTGHPPTATGTGAVRTDHPQSASSGIGHVLRKAAEVGGMGIAAYANRGIIRNLLGRAAGLVRTGVRGARAVKGVAGEVVEVGENLLPYAEEAAMLAI